MGQGSSSPRMPFIPSPRMRMSSTKRMPSRMAIRSSSLLKKFRLMEDGCEYYGERNVTAPSLETRRRRSTIAVNEPACVGFGKSQWKVSPNMGCDESTDGLGQMSG